MTVAIVALLLGVAVGAALLASGELLADARRRRLESDRLARRGEPSSRLLDEAAGAQAFAAQRLGGRWHYPDDAA